MALGDSPEATEIGPAAGLLLICGLAFPCQSEIRPRRSMYDNAVISTTTGHSRSGETLACMGDALKLIVLAPFQLVGERSMWTPRRPPSLEEVVERVANFGRAFHVGEVSAIFECDQLSVRNCPRNMRGDLAGEEIVIAPDN